MILNAVVASYVLALIAVPVVLIFHLLPTVFAGLAVYILTVKIARRLPVKWGSLSHKLALTVLVSCVMLALFGIGLALWSLLDGGSGMAALLSTGAETLENLRHRLAPNIDGIIPHTMEDLQRQINSMLHEHAQKISAVGVAGLKIFVHLLLGMVIGGITAIKHFDTSEKSSLFVSALKDRIRTLVEAFDKVVFAQVKISALNTVLTGIYLIVVLPLFGIHMPMLTVLISLTFVIGLIPIVGNVISNTAIVLISLGISPAVAIASLIFLIVIHKLEYFTNAYIVGGEVQARSWEMLCAMLLMEAMFGIPGLIAAPVAYAWLKEELRVTNVI
ncbi:MAG: AI-2E family transporter [Desulfomonilaceae bacterium]